MKWCKELVLSRPLRGLSLGTSAQGGTEEARLQERERAGYDRGLVEGEKNLSEQLLRQRAELHELQNGVLTSLRQAVSQVVQQSEAALIQLALTVAERLVDSLPISAEMVEASVRAALAKVEPSAEYRIYVHRDDLALLNRANSPLLAPGVGPQKMCFVASPDVSRGGCLVETRFGVIDARRETKAALIQQTLGV